MEPKQKKADRTYTPNVGIRLLGWLGIYFCAQLPLIAHYQFLAWFPMGLISPYVQPLLPHSQQTSYLPFELRCGVAVAISYLFYLAHFILTVLLPSRHAFRVLMMILVVAVVLNLVGCMMSVGFQMAP